MILEEISSTIFFIIFKYLNIIKMKFTQFALLSSGLCVILSLVYVMNASYFDIVTFFTAFIMSNIPSSIYLLIKGKDKEKNGVLFFILQNSIVVIMLFGQFIAS